MAVMLLAYYEVADADRFMQAFDGFEGARRQAGAITHGLVRSLDDPRKVVAMIEFASRGAAEAFAADPVRLDTLTEAGVLERADDFFEVVRPLASISSA